MSGVMRRNAATNDCVPVAMVANFGMLIDERSHEVETFLATRRGEAEQYVGLDDDELIRRTRWRF